MDTITPRAAPAAPGADTPSVDDDVTGSRGDTVSPEPVDRPVGLCPYLLAASGDWRAPAPRKEHRCAAFMPPASLAAEKQARLCLRPEHVGCATFVAARRARDARLGEEEERPRVGRWNLARTPALVEDPGGSRAVVAGLVHDRRTWQLAPAAVLVVAVVALAVSGFRNASAVAPIPSPSPTPMATSTSPVTAAPSALGTVVTTPAPTLPLTPPPTTPASTAIPTTIATQAPSARASYKVVSGDTLSGIAAKFKTTVAAIMTLNGLSSTSLHIGQVLLIP